MTPLEQLQARLEEVQRTSLQRHRAARATVANLFDAHTAVCRDANARATLEPLVRESLHTALDACLDEFCASVAATERLLKEASDLRRAADGR